jgi:putative ABC transport system substrate-binding protein
MNRRFRILLFLFISVAVSISVFLSALCSAVEAQQVGKVPRIGYLSGGSPSSSAPFVDAFRQGLRERGYVEGHNIAIEERFAEGKFDRLPHLAGELVRLRADVIVTAGQPAIRAAMQAASTTPIVMAISGDAVETGLVTSLARPGGNVTGLSILAPELTGKRLQLLKEAVPQVSRVAVLWNPTNQDSQLNLESDADDRTGLGVGPAISGSARPKRIRGCFRRDQT